MTERESPLLDATRRYLQRGWMPVYVEPGTKGPKEKGWQNRRFTEADLPTHFNRPGNVGIILGEASGGLVDVDLDCPEALDLADRYLPPTGAETGRPSAPRSHRWYVADVPATKQFRDPKTGEMIVELRSTGGQTLVGPSRHDETDEPYDTLDGEPAQVAGPMLAACVKALYEEVVCRRYGEMPKKRRTTRVPKRRDMSTSTDETERRALAYLNAMPPAVSGQGGHNATYAAATALVHGFGIPPEKALQILLEHYNPRCQPPWSEKELRHKVEDAATKPHDLPYGWLRDADPLQEATGVDISALAATVGAEPAAGEDLEAPRPAGPADPGPMPDTLLQVPGFVGEVMDYCMSMMAAPNPGMAFCGAMALLAYLAGRKVCDPGNLRTNVYLIALAYSGSGKNKPREVNVDIITAVGLLDGYGRQMASGEGLEDKLLEEPSRLYQTDEIDTLLQAVKDDREGRTSYLMRSILELFSNAHVVYPVRHKASRRENRGPQFIVQPNLVIFGTAIPDNYWGAMNAKMLSNGFFARILAVEWAGETQWQQPVTKPIPPSILAQAKAWADEKPGRGNLAGEYPQPRVIPRTPEADRFVQEVGRKAHEEVQKAHRAHDEARASIWNRLYEQVNKLALLHAVSRNQYPEHGIDLAAVQWANAFVTHLVKRMLFQASTRVAEGPFHALCLKFKNLLRAHDRRATRSWMTNRMCVPTKMFNEVVQWLYEAGAIDVTEGPKPKAGPTPTVYVLMES